MVDPAHADEVLIPMRAGERLRAARVKAKLDLGDVATRTRIPQRHLEAIERGEIGSLPSPTYAVGFAKSYAREIGEDGEDIARVLRDELGQRQPGQRGEAIDFDDADPSRVPGRTLAWTAAAIALLIAVSYGAWRSWLMSDRALPPAAPQVASAPATRAPTPVASTDPAGEVVLAAKQPVWLRVYDGKDKVLFEKEMAAGERFAVPRDADTPMIRTGRAELLTVMLDGREVAALGPAERTIKDVEISAAALAARAPAPVPAADNPAANVGLQP